MKKSLTVSLFMAAACAAACVSGARAMMVTSSRIAYVNIERVFSEMQGVEDARKKLKDLIEQRKMEIAETEDAIESIRSKMESKRMFADTVVPPAERKKTEPVSVSTSAETADVETSTGTAENEDLEESRETQTPDFMGEIKELEKLLSDKEKDLERLMIESKRLLLRKEEELKHNIMGKIYDTIESVAREKGYTVILDKEVVLFSLESVNDITDEIIRKLDEKH